MRRPSIQPLFHRCWARLPQRTCSTERGIGVHGEQNTLPAYFANRRAELSSVRVLRTQPQLHVIAQMSAKARECSVRIAHQRLEGWGHHWLANRLLLIAAPKRNEKRASLVSGHGLGLTQAPQLPHALKRSTRLEAQQPIGLIIAQPTLTEHPSQPEHTQAHAVDLNQLAAGI